MIDKPRIESAVDTSSLLWEGEGYLLPEKVRVWAGLGNDAGAYGHGIEASELAIDNDSGRTFVQIASIIEAHAEEL